MKIHELYASENGDETWLYANGHIDKEAFLKALREAPGIDTPRDCIEAFTAQDVEHVYFRRMSPSEARQRGLDWGWWKGEGRYKMTGLFF